MPVNPAFEIKGSSLGMAHLITELSDQSVSSIANGNFSFPLSTSFEKVSHISQEISKKQDVYVVSGNLDGLANVVKSHPEIVFVIIGDNAEAASYLEPLDLNIETRVH